MKDLEHVHWEGLKWVLRYFNGIVSYHLVYRQCTHNKADKEGFVSFDYVGNVDTKTSLSRYVFYIVWNNNLLEIQFVINDSFMYYPKRVYDPHKGV